MDVGFRADLIVQDLVIVELKSLEQVLPVHKKILLTYLRLTGKQLGLLMNFGEEYLRDGITRIVNGLEEGAPNERTGQAKECLEECSTDDLDHRGRLG